MYVPFSELPNSSRIWIYQSDKVLSELQKKEISSQLELFCNEWTAHSNKLKSSFEIRHNHFIILAVDESSNDASGCSIDKSVSIIKKIENDYKLSFFNRENLAFLIDQKVLMYSLSDIKNCFNEEKINGQSIFFNNLSPTKGDLSHNWMIKVEDSWLKTYSQQ